ncbi:MULTISPECIES: metallopeptidase TldD-related protein [unclassified Brenneria]|uniref:TldD/PmbA family protein n=1 Tax=unclassified Brenneria TaxID=2634434 RepID=UPI0029C25850|nr:MULTISPECIES: metallopeptidase TldD-related protein [unclassified Brenneria]MDX5628200.1 metallopeptidase TldD-related protein [Brenneria sp. L3-3Z]MDX5694780.1 metallopeptidase TldD-related protein [Brenneria sp. L4-2C]
MFSLHPTPSVDAPQTEALQSAAEQILTLAGAKGATQTAVYVSQGSRRNIKIRNGDIDTLTQNHGRHLSVTVYFGLRSGSVSSTQFSPDALREAVESACTLAKYGDEDPYGGLPDQHRLATDIRDLELYDAEALSVEQALALARRAEQAANETAPGDCHNESAAIASYQGQFILANSSGFCAGYPSSSHTLWSQALARNADQRQRGHWSLTRRAPAQLVQPETIGRIAAERALAQLGAQKLATRRCPVLFEAPAAHSLIHHLVNALSGGSLYRSASFLGLCAGESIIAPHLSLYEDPFIPGAPASACFDAEGVAASARHVIEDGVAQGYFLSSYSARRLGLITTGNAGGACNLSVASSLSRPDDTLPVLLRNMHNGLLVTTLLGQGLNPMTGDYSQGVSGFWVENGEIQYPVEEITIAGNLKTMLRQCVALGADAHTQGYLTCGSLLIAEMQIAGR